MSDKAQKTVRATIAVAVDEYGDWFAYGTRGIGVEATKSEAIGNVAEGCQVLCYTMEVDLQVPGKRTVAPLSMSISVERADLA